MGVDPLAPASVVVWGRGPVMPHFVRSLAAHTRIAEVWCQDREAAMSPDNRAGIEAAIGAARLAFDVNSTAAVVARLDRLPPVAAIAECFYTNMISGVVTGRVPVINVHPSPLPRYRGAHPLPWQIINGETRSALTYHLVTPAVDAGPILRQIEFEIAGEDSYTTVLAKVFAAIAANSGEVIASFLAGAIHPRSQNEREATYVAKRCPDDGWIDWHASARSIYNFVRALNDPLPGAWSLWNGRKVILDAVVPDASFGAYVGRTIGQVVGLGGVKGILAADDAVIPRRVRDAATGEDVTAAIRVNDRFTRPPGT